MWTSRIAGVSASVSWLRQTRHRPSLVVDGLLSVFLGSCLVALSSLPAVVHPAGAAFTSRSSLAMFGEQINSPMGFTLFLARRGILADRWDGFHSPFMEPWMVDATPGVTIMAPIDREPREQTPDAMFVESNGLIRLEPLKSVVIPKSIDDGERNVPLSPVLGSLSHTKGAFEDGPEQLRFAIRMVDLRWFDPAGKQIWQTASWRMREAGLPWRWLRVMDGSKLQPVKEFRHEGYLNFVSRSSDRLFSIHPVRLLLSLVAAAFLAWFALGLARTARSLTRHRRGLCPRCAYPRVATGCPECGFQVSATKPPMTTSTAVSTE